MKLITRRKASFFAQFVSGFLIAGQLCCGLPAFATDTLRAVQEAETHKAGIEQKLRPAAGIEESERLTAARLL